MDIRVEFMDSKLYNYKFYATAKLKIYLYGEGRPINIINKRVFFDFVYLITPKGYNSLESYIF